MSGPCPPRPVRVGPGPVQPMTPAQTLAFLVAEGGAEPGEDTRP